MQTPVLRLATACACRNKPRCAHRGVLTSTAWFSLGLFTQASLVPPGLSLLGGNPVQQSTELDALGTVQGGSWRSGGASVSEGGHECEAGPARTCTTADQERYIQAAPSL